MNIMIIGGLVLASVFTSSRENNKQSISEAVVLINGAPMAAAIAADAEVVEVYGPVPSYFSTDLTTAEITKEVKATSPDLVQVELSDAITIVDTSRWSEFAPDEVSLLREIAIIQENKKEPTGIMVIGSNASSSIQSRIINLLHGFGIDKSLIESKLSEPKNDVSDVVVGIYKIPT